ncbi:MAG: hypothetical protein AMS23_03595 [Bacteroides sp. SM1_62]|nr:MAG: hypothetical protein AMS23_03595 [Bacteroides sp. SM1_62]
MGSFTIEGYGGVSVILRVPVRNPTEAIKQKVNGFIESNGYVSMEAENYTRSVDRPPVSWLRIPGLGRTLSGITPVPVTYPAQETAGDGPRLEYQVHLFCSGEIKIRAYLFPTLDFHYSGGLKYTISIDDEDLQIINIHEGATNRVWEQWLRNNINLQVSKHYADRPGDHTVKFWMVDPGIVLEKLEVVTGESKAIFLGPAESHYQSEAEGK